MLALSYPTMLVMGVVMLVMEVVMLVMEVVMLVMGVSGLSHSWLQPLGCSGVLASERS